MINGHLPGDIILIEPTKAPSFNTSYQSAIRLRKSKYSHVAIVLDPGTIIHSMPKSGVSTELFSKFKTQLKSRRFQVIRHVRMDKSESLRFELRNRLLFYRRQKYNFLFSFGNSKKTSYCSELAAKAYRDINISVCRKTPKRTLPIDLQPLLSNSEWINVTPIYAPERTHTATALKSFFEKSNALIDESAELNFQLEDLMQESVRQQKNMLMMINELHAIFGLNEVKLDFPREYWDSKPK